MSAQSLMLAERYLLEEQIARGGMTSLWRARDEVLARHVAVKILHAELAQDEVFRERFLREALGAARLSHPNIAQIYDTGSEVLDGPAEQHFIVLEYCAGGSLENLRAQGLPEHPRVTGIGAAVCNALAYAHANGVLHGDLRPANVLLTGEGGVKVADFGIARAAYAAKDLSTTGTILGSVKYLAPEQVEQGEPDERSDLYSLGIVLFELLAGRGPFEEASDLQTMLQRLREPAPSIRSFKGGIPRALDAAVLKAIARDPQDRYRSAEEMRDALARAVAPSGGATQVLRATPEVRHQVRREDTPVVAGKERSELRKIIPIALLIAAAIAAALVVPSFLDDSNKEPPPVTTQASGGGGGTQPIQGVQAQDFDPYGGDGEHPELVSNLTDGDPSTAWMTSDYQDPLQAQKPGVGVLFDLGSPQEVSRVEILFGTPDVSIELRSGDRIGENEQAFTTVQQVSGTNATEDIDAGGTSARYWLVWITELPGGGGGNASINEVRFFAP